MSKKIADSKIQAKIQALGDMSWQVPQSTARKRRSPFVIELERKAGFAALYVIGPRWLPKAITPAGYKHWPVKVGVTTSPKAVASSCRQWNHLKVRLMALYWTQSPELARRLKSIIEMQLKGQGAHHHGSWYDRDPDLLEMELRFFAEQEKIELFDEHERQVRIKGMAARRATTGGRLI